MANLTLMALGSSAPEILLSVYETIQKINSTPGELGPATIVGSAAFNLLVISAVSVVSVDEVKKIDDIGVFAITSVASMFAYIWLYLVLKVISPGYVTVVEALLTLFYFFLLIGCSYAADRYRNKNLNKQRSEEERKEIEIEKTRLVAKAWLRKLASSKGNSYVVECVSGGTYAANAPQDLKEEVKSNYCIALGVTSTDELQLTDLIGALEVENLIERLQQRKQHNEKKQFIKLKGTHQQLEHKNDKSTSPNAQIGFKCTHYSVTESSGFVEIIIAKKVAEEVTVVVRTENDTAKAPEDYEHVEKEITLAKNEKEQTFKVKIHDDDIWEPDKDFKVVLCNKDTKEKLDGDDVCCTVTILDEDQPGILGFSEKSIKVRKKDKFAYVKVVRTDGADGEITCRCSSLVLADIANQAAEYTDFCPYDERLVFGHQETEKMVKIELYQTATIGAENGEQAEEQKRKDSDSESEDAPDSMLVFQVKLEDPQPRGTKLSKKQVCFVQIVGDNEAESAEDKMQQKMLEYLLQQKEATWAQQFKIAVMLGPTIDEDNQMDDVGGMEALWHFFAIGWNVLFALIPPRRYLNGGVAFFVALGMIGFCTAIVAEFANLLGCAIGLKTSVTAITLVALGTSLPDTLASKIAAQNSDNADSAIGNITGSNSVNVFLGLGLPWVLATIYRKSTTGEDYAVPSGTLAFSVMLFLCTAVVCFAILVLRRKVSGNP